MEANGVRIARIERATLDGKRPRYAGKNARLGDHGPGVRVPVCRITDSDGATGVGLSRLQEADAYRLLGMPVAEVFTVERGTTVEALGLDYPLWDLAGRRAGVPVCQLGPLALGGDEPSPTVRCYDTTLYFDDLVDGAPEVDDDTAAALIASEARAGYERGHRAFKIKVGRGARWMSPAAGLDRDVAIVAAVRDAVGPACPIYTDANNGFTLRGAVEFIDRTAEHHIGWLEEPFHEDAVLLAALRQWIDEAGLDVALADGETATAEEGAALAERGLLDVVQCDVMQIGFTGWAHLGLALDAVGVTGAVHHYGLQLGNYVTGHLSSFLRGLGPVEWDEAATPGLTAPGYRIIDGTVQMPDDPGFGVETEEDVFAAAVAEGGFDLGISSGR
jgi:L-rhamnonate dehydratase